MCPRISWLWSTFHLKSSKYTFLMYTRGWKHAAYFNLQAEMLGPASASLGFPTRNHTEKTWGENCCDPADGWSGVVLSRGRTALHCVSVSLCLSPPGRDRDSAWKAGVPCLKKHLCSFSRRHSVL